MSKAWVYGRSLAVIVGSNPACFSHVRVECCKTGVFATDKSPFQESPTGCGLSECDRGNHE
jgi:hypothetical protein